MGHHEPRAVGSSVWRPIAVIVLVVSVACGLAMAPTLLWLLPKPLRVRPVTSISVAIALLYAAVSASVQSGRLSKTRFVQLRRTLFLSEAAGNQVLDRVLLPALLTVSAAYFLAWLPHFLLTPWSRDSDTFATLALDWKAGVIPYRDTVGYNFPGHIYLFWLIGTVLGWGQTWGLYLVDALILILFAAALLAWSHRIFRTLVPGAISLLLVLMYYTRVDFQLNAQRDWHATVAIASSILTAEAYRTRGGRVTSALIAAVALSIRPHVLAFLPAIFWALGESDRSGARHERTSRSLWTRQIVEWLSGFGLFTALLFVPLLLAGAIPGFIGGLNHYVLSGSYGSIDRAAIVAILSDVSRSSQTRMLLPLLAVMAAFAPGRYGSSAMTWLLVVIGAVIYRMSHPVQHNYLSYPFFIMRMLALAPVAAWLCQAARIPSVSKLSALCALSASSLVLGARAPEITPALAAVASIAAGEWIPASPPPGAWTWYHEAFPQWYPWSDYRKTLLYLHHYTNAATTIANVLRSPPFPAINGPTGRRSPFRTESGICWIWFIHEDRDAEFAQELESGSCDFVVWVPGEEAREPRMSLPKLCAAIRGSFAFEVQFGRIEIWRRIQPGLGRDETFAR